MKFFICSLRKRYFIGSLKIKNYKGKAWMLQPFYFDSGLLLLLRFIMYLGRDSSKIIYYVDFLSSWGRAAILARDLRNLRPDKMERLHYSGDYSGIHNFAKNIHRNIIVMFLWIEIRNNFFECSPMLLPKTKSKNQRL